NDSRRRDPEVGRGRKRETRSQGPVKEGRYGHPSRPNRVHKRGDRVRCSRAEWPPREQLFGLRLPGGGLEDSRPELLSAIQLSGWGSGGKRSWRSVHLSPEVPLAGTPQGQAGAVRETDRSGAGRGCVVPRADRGREATG